MAWSPGRHPEHWRSRLRRRSVPAARIRTRTRASRRPPAAGRTWRGQPIRRPSPRTPEPLATLVEFLLRLAILELLVLGSRLRNDFADGALARRRLEPVGARSLALRAQLHDERILVGCRLTQAGDEHLVVAHAGHAPAPGRALPEHFLILGQVALELARATLCVGQFCLCRADRHRVLAFGFGRELTYRFESLGSFHWSAIVCASCAMLRSSVPRPCMSWCR